MTENKNKEWNLRETFDQEVHPDDKRLAVLMDIRDEISAVKSFLEKAHLEMLQMLKPVSVSPVSADSKPMDVGQKEKVILRPKKI